MLTIHYSHVAVSRASTSARISPIFFPGKPIPRIHDSEASEASLCSAM